MRNEPVLAFQLAALAVGFALVQIPEGYIPAEHLEEIAVFATAALGCFIRFKVIPTTKILGDMDGDGDVDLDDIRAALRAARQSRKDRQTK